MTKQVLRSAAITTKTYAEPANKVKKVTTYPKLEFEASDVPELQGKPTGYECMVLMKVRKVNEGLEDSWNAPDSQKLRNMLKVEVLGTMKHSPKKASSLSETMSKRRNEMGY